MASTVGRYATSLESRGVMKLGSQRWRRSGVNGWDGGSMPAANHLAETGGNSDDENVRGL